MKKKNGKYSNLNWGRTMGIWTIVAGIMLFISATAFAADPSGYWCRSEGGNLVDVIGINHSGEIFKITFREGWDKQIYADGVGTLISNRLSATVRKTMSDKANNPKNNNIHVYMTISGDSLSYRSWNIDGSFRWSGEYVKCKQ